VSWRTGGDYVGWAPLPPRRRYAGAGEIVYEGRPIYGQVDIEFDIGPAYYNFVDIRYIGAPVLRQHIYAPTQNVTYISRTVNVTNITYNNSVVYNYGPDYERMNAYSTRPIQRLTLQRQTDVDLQSAVQSGGVTKVQGNQLIVAAPVSMEAPAQPVAPKNLKTRITDPGSRNRLDRHRQSRCKSRTAGKDEERRSEVRAAAAGGAAESGSSAGGLDPA
jgi:hypothetical protein